MDSKEQSPPEQPPVSSHRLGEINEDVQMVLYWWSRPPEERISAMEDLRQMLHGEDYETKYRLSRTDPVVKRFKLGSE